MKRHVDNGALYAALELKREEVGRSWRDIAQDLGVSPSTFSRLSKGGGVDTDTFVTLTGWLGVSPESFVVGEKASSERSEETMAVIASYLRADRNLKPRSATAIETVLRAAYVQLSEQPAPK
jgi:transcriptional regulator with XRE-family HTH domain